MESITKEILPGIFRLTLSDTTIEQGVSEIHIFIIPGKPSSRSLMIDTGFKTTNCLERLEQALHELHISYSDLDIFLTHRHHDHCGLAGILSKKGARLFMNPSEERHPYDCLAYRLSDESFQAQKDVLCSAGITAQQSPAVWNAFMHVTHRIQQHGEWVLAILGFPFQPVQSGDRFNYGAYQFEAIPLKGHTYGQLGLIDRDHKILFAADQVLDGMSPIIATTYPDESLLQSFFDSLEMIKHTCTEEWCVIPAHGPIIADLPSAVDHTVYSYLNKASAVKNLLEEWTHNPKSAGCNKTEPTCPGYTIREIAESIYHVATPPNDEASFFIYKMFITKTFSLLEYLNGLGFVTRTLLNGTYYWNYKEPNVTEYHH